MNEIPRELTKKLVEWCNYTNRSPLILRGARQVGKTHLVKKFAKDNFSNLAYANFEENEKLKSCFNDLDINKIISSLEFALNEDLIAGETLLFLDEIQDCPNAVTALRYFKEKKPDLHVIAAGSLLEFILNDEKFSIPVGRVEYLYLKPLSFYEFLIANSKSKSLEILKQCNITNAPADVIHEQLLLLCQEYMALGGMPSVVTEYVTTKNLQRCEDLLGDLIISYREDFGKYAKQIDHKYLQKVYDKVPRMISQWFKYVKVDEDIHPKNIRRALDLLSLAGILSRVYASNATGIPLSSTQNDKKFKVIFLDTGLVRIAQQINLDLIYNLDLELLNKGQLTEQFVGQELLVYAPKIQQNKIYFWQREEKNSQAEVDYLYTHNGEIYPIEVKSGSIGRLKSMKIFMEEKKSKIGIRISSLPLSFNQGILSVPFYMIAELPRLIEEAKKNY